MDNTLSEATQETALISNSPKMEEKSPIKDSGLKTVLISDSTKMKEKAPIKDSGLKTVLISDSTKMEEKALRKDSGLKTVLISDSTKMEEKTPRKDSGLKTMTPIHRLQLPKVSTLADRCMSPTDLLISPVSKRLLSRNRKGSGLSAPPKNPSKEVISLAI